MSVNHVRVSSRSAKLRRPVKIRTFVLFGFLAVLGSVISVFGYDYYSGKLGLIGPQFNITATARGRVIRVPPGGNLQGALEAATSGDIIELQAGAVYSGQI